MQFQDELAGGVTLVRPALQSPNFVSGATGWAVLVDGSAEFNNVIIRGSTTVSGTSLYYNGAPALGNLIGSLASTAGVDSLGNSYRSGFTVYSNDGSGRYAQMTTVGNIALGYTSVFPNAGELQGVGTGVRLISPYSNASPDDHPVALTILPGDTAGAGRGQVGIAHINVPAHDVRLFLGGNIEVDTQETATNAIVVDAVAGTTGRLTSWRVNAAELSYVRADGSLIAANQDAGSASAVMVAVSSVDVAVNFNKTFPSAPQVVASLVGNPGLPAGSSALTVRPHTVTTTGCTLRVNDVGGVARTLTHRVDWFATSQ